MPDPLLQTISATEMPGLFGVSPYVTPFMLYHRFVNNVAIDDPENNRMMWGRRMQPLLLQAAAEDLRLEIRDNNDDVYRRRGRLGCTPDGEIICPDRGPGAIETKCVFDYKVWMEKWEGGRKVPTHYEIQLQQQMLVGDGRKPFTWGTFAVFVCGAMHYFERKAVGDLWDRMIDQTAQFFHAVNTEREPSPTGESIELPYLAQLFPTVPESVLDLRDDPDHVKTAENLSIYNDLKDQERGAERGRKVLQAQFMALAKGSERVLLPCGANYRIQKSGKGYTVNAYVPETPSPAPISPNNIIMAG